MTGVYAHLMDSTLKRAIEEYRAKKVDISGTVVPDTGAAAPEAALALHGPCRSSSSSWLTLSG